MNRLLKAIAISTAVLLSSPAVQAREEVHLVMLTGDERMQNLDENVTYLPQLHSGLPESQIIAVKSAYQRKHLGHWHDSWTAHFRGREIRDDAQGWILDELIQKARSAAGEKKLASVTLVWAQGAADTSEGFSASYAQTFQAMANQLAKELGRQDLRCVIARLGVADETSKRHPEWEAIRAAHENLGDSLPHACWVDTDSVTDKSKDSSEILGRLLADATLKQIRSTSGVKAAALIARPTPERKAPAHLFLLSGQSNMAGLDPAEAFVPAVTETFGEDGTIVIKAAYGAKSISHWYKWNKNPRPEGDPDPRNWLYRELIGKARFAIADRDIRSVTLCWMQGEADASSETSAAAYAANFEGMLDLLREDLGRDDIHFVIGRLSDHSNPEKFPAWESMRRTQVDIAERSPQGRWIDTDALNGDDNNLHYPSGEDGKIALARSFAAQAIELARSTPN